MGYNPNKTTWFNPSIEYIFNVDCVEYDMKDAGFNIIKQYRLLPSEKIIELERMGKGIERHIAIGKLQGADKLFSQQLTDKFAEMRRIFIESNKIDDNDIISVKKDAIFVIGERNKLKFGLVEFAPKNKYSSYIRFTNASNIEIYYSDDKLDVKQLGDSAVNKHRLYLIEFIKKIMEMIESKDERVKRFIIKFMMDYKAGILDDEYYIRLDRTSRDVDPLFNYQKIIIPLVQIIMREIE